MIEIQNILDNLMAFWGIIDDSIGSENVRNLIKIGKRVERLDLYARLKFDRESLIREYARLAARLERTRLTYDKTSLALIASFLEKEKPDYHQIVSETENCWRFNSI